VRPIDLLAFVDGPGDGIKATGRRPTFIAALSYLSGRLAAVETLPPHGYVVADRASTGCILEELCDSRTARPRSASAALPNVRDSVSLPPHPGAPSRPNHPAPLLIASRRTLQPQPSRFRAAHNPGGGARQHSSSSAPRRRARPHMPRTSISPASFASSSNSANGFITCDQHKII